jgi:hypothetical protein
LTVIRVVGDFTIEADKVEQCQSKWTNWFMFGCSAIFIVCFLIGLFNYKHDLLLAGASFCIAGIGIISLLFTEWILPCKCGIRVHLTEPTPDKSKWYYPEYQFQLSNNPTADAEIIKKYAGYFAIRANGYMVIRNAQKRVEAECDTKYQGVLGEVYR